MKETALSRSLVIHMSALVSFRTYTSYMFVGVNGFNDFFASANKHFWYLNQFQTDLFS